MTVENDKDVDIISTKKGEGTVVLTISDHLDWSDSTSHQLVIQKKLNTYLAFIESGELLDRYPTAKGLAVEIRIVFQHRPDRSAEAFLTKAKQIVDSAGFKLHTEVFAESYGN